MKDLNLECVPAWRYCTVRAGEKIPFPKQWQTTPLVLADITTDNLGLLLGPCSGGVVALDFDGASAWSWFDQTFDIELPPTIAWTSGKDARCQMAFTVPEDYWPLLRTQKISTGPGEGFEFRWDRTQSVMPPSRLTDGRQYTWFRAPSQTDLVELPEAVLDWWVMKCNPVPVAPAAYPAATEQQVLELAQELKSLYPELTDYDTWTRVTWAFCNTIGYADGIALMQWHWPEQRPGEYKTLGNKPPAGRRCTIGTVKKLIGQRRTRKVSIPSYYQMQLAQEIKHLEDEINRRKQHAE